MAQRVLVVDDDPTVSDVVRRYLERAEYDVTLAVDGQGALDAVAARRPDLVVLDLMLPGIDGLEVCRRLRSNDPNLPVVMLTALGDEADRVVGPVARRGRLRDQAVLAAGAGAAGAVGAAPRGPGRPSRRRATARCSPTAT